jgi:hypothetical protein
VVLGEGSRLPSNELGEDGSRPDIDAVWQEQMTRRVSVESHPVLRSHVLDGRAVLPVALSVEWLAHAALHAHPGMRFLGFDQFRVLQAMKLNGETRLLSLATGETVREGEVVKVSTILRSGREGEEAVPHARATIVLGRERSTAPGPELEPPGGSYPIPRAELYRERLFHGPDFQAIESLDGWSESGIAATVGTAPSPAEWMRDPLRGVWIADPLAVDVGFQLLILWSQQALGVGSLPVYIERYRQYGRRFPSGPLCLVARVNDSNERRAVADLEWSHGGELVARMEGYECVIDAALERAFRLNSLTPVGGGGADEP